MHPIGQAQMAQNDRATPHGAMRTYLSTACNANATGHGCVFANVHVVAYLNQIVEFDAILNDRVLKRPTIDAGIGTNFDIVSNFDGAQLLYFFPGALIGCKAETIGSNDNA